MNIDNKVKELEVFLGDKTVLKSIFGTDKPTLNRAFGNPWWYPEESLKAIRMDYVWEESLQVRRMNSLQPGTKPLEKPDKPYRPRKSTIEKLRKSEAEIQIQISAHLRTVSPFPIHNNTTEEMNHKKFYKVPIYGRQVLEQLLSFSSQQLCAMEPITKEKVIEVLLFSIKQAVRKYRNSFFHKGFMFEGDFEENKLGYLLENGDEPIIVSEDDYEFLEEHYMTAMSKQIHRVFEEAYYFGGEDEVLLLRLPDNDIRFEFMHTCAKRFSYLNRRVFSSLSSRYTDDLLYVLDEKDIDFSSYHVLQCCPITDMIKGFKMSNDGAAWLKHLYIITCIEPSRLFKLLTKEKYVYIMNETMSYLKFVLGHDMNSLEGFNEKFIESSRGNIGLGGNDNFYARLFYHFEHYIEMQKQ